MIRSGSTVLYQIASGIIELRQIGMRCGYYEPPGAKPVLPQEGWAVYKVPWLCEWEREKIRQGAIALYSFRDMEEALQSAYRAFKIPEGDRWLYRALMEGHNREMWLRVKAHTIGFDQIADQLRQSIECIAGWLPGRPLTDKELDSLAEDLSLERQKARPKVEPFDPVTLLAAQHFG